MKIICDSCQTKYSIADEKVRGKVFKIKCKKCSHIIVVRGAAGEEVAAAVDEKETKVFDYSGYDNPSEAAAAMAAGGGDEAVWHLVIDQEQVGPLTKAEVMDRFRTGVIDAESYTWREGFGDWQRLAAVEDFAADVAGGGAAAPMDHGGAAAVAGLASDEPPPGDDAVAGMFGGAFDDGAAQNDPADLFSAAAGDAGMGGGGDDAGGGLFGGDQMAAADPGGGLFGDADAGGMDMGGGMAASEAPPEALTGERNENSVLFSLSNLASLAADAPKAAPVPSAGGGGGGGGSAGMAQAGGQEGSGLIDIRSMAQVYLGDKQGGGGVAGPAAPAAPDDLPVFSSGSFEGGGQVLLPTSQTSGNNKILYALMGLIGLLAVVAVVLTVVILKKDDDKGGGDGQLAGQTGGTGEDGKVTPPGTGDGTGTGDTGTGTGDTATGTGDTATGTGDTGTGTGDTAIDTGDTGTTDTEDKRAKDKKPKDKRAKDKKPKDKRAKDKKPKDKRAKDKKPKDTKPTGRKEKCDEVACLVDPSLPCCKGSKGKKGKTGGTGKVDPNLQERPSRTDISAGIGKVRGRVQSCGDKHGFKGTVTVKITVAGSGKVSNAKANKGSGAFKSCVKSSVKKAKFKKSQKGITVNYPFVFR